ncbi:hypothetical protein ACVIHI_008869 [Bradyrhizobium sp. USDA 4524]|uniref:DUF3102 domain-containing protein n=1 Tax=unclassified Bradyrhizobium TaxID=2631580 RepID=UPI0020A165EC|nr:MULTISPECIES: DUF3102 domain-containing protein [unclassified Bradyrhizobium]MCP1845662.1 hypothetical protein [Bradyrhizobium sp. USDA 4538]MCP1907014.1 hypothetical protein [Bradyrhizobium sp. USDA 4537]MCP1985490.1 hypothetical protein [Bradyrhizobium sp. USDA 4539]
MNEYRADQAGLIGSSCHVGLTHWLLRIEQLTAKKMNESTNNPALICVRQYALNSLGDETLGGFMSGNAAGLVADNRYVASSSLKFDYAGVSPSVEAFLRGQADRIRRQCASSIIQIGKALLEAKRHLSHGVFLGWVESEVGIPCRTAQAYMRAAQWAAGKSAAVAHLPVSAIYMLSANGVPEQFVVDVLERLEAGEQIGAVAIRQELRTFVAQSRRERSVASEDASRSVRAQYPIDEERAGLGELAAFLARKLSDVDFARVCQILTSDSVLSDPDLAEELGRHFRVATKRAELA